MGTYRIDLTLDPVISGEKRVITTQIDAPTGITATITSRPTWTLVDDQNTVVSSGSVDAWDDTAASTVYSQMELDTSNLSAGNYYLFISVDTTGSDSLDRNEIQVVKVPVRWAPVA